MDSKDNILSALEVINPADLDYADWLRVGMALQYEGYGVDVWDSWSRSDPRYKRNDCTKRWNGFSGDGDIVTGATIVQMAKDRGWRSWGDDDGVLDWNSPIEYDGDVVTPQKEWHPAEELIRYLEVLFEPSDIVAYVTNGVEHDDEGDRWILNRGTYSKTAGQLIEEIRAHPDDLSYAIGTTNPKAGAWIRFNPVDGQGVENRNVTRFTYALVESDEMPVEEQDFIYRKLQLPIAALVHSGGKSLHAIVRVDAKDAKEYAERVSFLYDFLGKHGLIVDKNNRNPSRLSRMPGVMREGNRQYLAATNIGRKSWLDWMDFAEGVEDDLPGIVPLSSYTERPPLAEELIEGILRRGHKMLISGPSKAGKSFLLMELCISIAEGTPFLGRKVRKGRVLYINLEISENSAINRIYDIYQALGIPMTHKDDILVWNLRGKAVPLDKLVPKLIRRVKDQQLDAIILDPIYKVITGDENNASDMGAFCNQFDRICSETKCAMIYCHHHSKGAQGAKKAMDRASGSGVFARDPDAQLDIIELALTQEVKSTLQDGNATAWRMESSLREFPNLPPINFWFNHPIHQVDTTGELAKLHAEGDARNNLNKSGNRRMTDEEKAAEVDRAYNFLPQPIKVADIAGYIVKDEKTARKWIGLNDDYFIQDGYVFPVER